LSFTLPTNVVLTDDKSKWNWQPPKCDVDTTRVWDKDGRPVGSSNAAGMAAVSNATTSTGSNGCAAAMPTTAPEVDGFKLVQPVEGGYQYVSIDKGGAALTVPTCWWGHTAVKNYPSGSAGKQGGVTLYYGPLPQ
jgi:hypothetical protein